jgi:pyruvate dehydrogenase E2 component (dihydrolipoamide acetyltransferase)
VDVPASTLRKVIAKRLVESKSTIPHFYVSVNVNMDKTLKLREELNKIQNKSKISVNDLVVKACGLALRDNPDANAYW